MSAHEPAGVRPADIVVCADDYAASPAGAEVILELLRAGAINATSCLVEAPAWPRAAEALRELKDQRPGLAVGLHLNLTEPLPGCARPEIVAGVGVQMLRSFTPGAAPRGPILEAMRAQWRAFEAAFGASPDFIDGHEHVHLAPAVREALFALITETGFSGWIRQCRTSSSRANWKRLVLDPLSLALTERAARAGVACNPGFGGLRRFRADEDLEAIWRTDLAAMTAGGVLMVHPGGPPREAALIAGGALNATLAADAVRPW